MMSVETAIAGIAARMRSSQSEVARRAGTSAASPSGRGPSPTAAGSGCARRPCSLVGHRLDHVGREVVRVRRREPDPPETVNLVDHPQEVGEQRPPRRARHRDVSPVRVHVLPEQRDLDDTRRHEALHLGQDVADRARALRASDERHDAERAGVVAARRDRDPRPERRRRERPATRSGTVSVYSRTSICGPSVSARSQQVEQVRQRVRADDDVDPRRLALDQALVLLGEAAGDDDPQARVRGP